MKNSSEINLNTPNNQIYVSEEITLLKEKLLDLKKKVNKILLIQPLQIEEDKIDIKIALNKRYYMYPPYGIGILNKVLKNNNYTSDVLDLNFETFSYIHEKKKYFLR